MTVCATFKVSNVKTSMIIMTLKTRSRLTLLIKIRAKLTEIWSVENSKWKVSTSGFYKQLHSIFQNWLLQRYLHSIITKGTFLYYNPAKDYLISAYHVSLLQSCGRFNKKLIIKESCTSRFIFGEFSAVLIAQLVQHSYQYLKILFNLQHVLSYQKTPNLVNNIAC